MTEAISMAASVVPYAAVFGSIATLGWLFQRHIAGRPLLAYEPRRPVPWNVVAPFALLSFVLTPVLAASLVAVAEPVERIAPVDAADEVALTSLSAGAAAAGPVVQYAVHLVSAEALVLTAEHSGELTVSSVATQAGMSIVLAVACYAVLALLFGANRSDLGWPASWAMAARDLRIGFFTFLAVIVPVYALQIALSNLFSPETQHPLIEELQVRHTSPMLFVAFAAAVVGAPLFEETAFRLILQGWLERIAGPWTAESAIDDAAILPDEVSTVEQASSTAEPITEVPTVWLPIVASGVLFAGAHLGQGVAPISLLPLGMVLGYVYQRTHRIVPSIVCHALFNAFSLFILWLALTSSEVPQ